MESTSREDTAARDPAMLLHERSAVRHEAAAASWERRGEPEWAELERRYAGVEHAAAQIESDRMRLVGLRPGSPAREAAAPDSVERLGTEPERVTARIGVKRERVDAQREVGRGEPAPRAPEIPWRPIQERAAALAAVLSRTADALEASAVLADEHAGRRDQAGCPDDAAKEREATERTRAAARPARLEAEQWRRQIGNKEQ